MDILLEVAGKDASQAYDDAGHSEDATEIMSAFRVGKLFNDGSKAKTTKTVRVAIQKTLPPAISSSNTSTALGATLGSVGAVTAAVLALRRVDLSALSRALNVHKRVESSGVAGAAGAGVGFTGGFVLASAIALVAGALAAKKFDQLITMHHPREAAHKKIPRAATPNPLLARGFLDPLTFQPLPLAEKELIAPNVYRLLFELPARDTVLGLPIGQHVSIKATVDGAAVQRSYTPTSNNSDKGILELVIKVYPDGALTGKYLANLVVGDEVMFRGPKGAMRYRRGLCKKIGMLAGGTGITPMYQLIRAICEDPRDTTEVSLVYANRTEGDILLRKELESFAKRYPMNLKIHYLLDQPPEDWTYGTGHVTKEIMAERFPDPRAEGTKAMLCGPPGMVNAAKKSLVALGFEKAALSSKMDHQVFCF